MGNAAFKKTYERVARYFTREKYLAELDEAKSTYFERTGKVFEDDANYEHQMAIFLEWYIFDRELSKLSIPPIRAYFLMFHDKVDPVELTTLKNMQRTVRSLCIYQGKKGKHELFEDLLVSQERLVENDGNIMGLHKGDLVDVRLVELDGGWYLCDTVQVHHTQAKSFILKELKFRKIESHAFLSDFLFELAYMKWKREHYQHLSVDQIYTTSAQA